MIGSKIKNEENPRQEIQMWSVLCDCFSNAIMKFEETYGFWRIVMIQYFCVCMRR